MVANFFARRLRVGAFLAFNRQRSSRPTATPLELLPIYHV
jgi:hypothetical protein